MTKRPPKKRKPRHAKQVAAKARSVTVKTMDTLTGTVNITPYEVELPRKPFALPGPNALNVQVTPPDDPIYTRREVGGLVFWLPSTLTQDLTPKPFPGAFHRFRSLFDDYAKRLKRPSWFQRLLGWLR